MDILLIDDDLDSLNSLTAAVAPAGNKCEKFTSPVQALETYRQHQGLYDVVITDMKMPGMNGIEFLKQARALNPEARVIIVTGYGDVETAIAAVNHGAYAFFGKPVDLVDLLDTLDKIKNEIDDKKKHKLDYERLAAEYRKLKQAYEDLQKLLQGAAAE